MIEPIGGDPTEANDAPAAQTATVAGTGAEGLRCRVSPSPDADVIATLAEGTIVEVVGTAARAWLPVECATGVPGYVSTDFVTIGTNGGGEAMPVPTAGEALTGPVETMPATVEVVTTPSESSASASESVPTAAPTAVPAKMSTVAPSPTPLPIAGIADSEQSETALYAIDGDPTTSWTVVPSRSPQQVTLTFDLGQVQPVGHLQLEMSTWNTLPQTEIWLSEDGVTWWNVTSVDGSTLQPDTSYDITLGYQASSIRIVVPHADQSGIAEIGGIRQVSVWASEDGNASNLATLGTPVTPEPLPSETPDATSAPAETDLPSQEGTVPPAGQTLPASDESTGGNPPADDSSGSDDPPVIEPEG